MCIRDRPTPGRRPEEPSRPEKALPLDEQGVETLIAAFGGRENIRTDAHHTDPVAIGLSLIHIYTCKNKQFLRKKQSLYRQPAALPPAPAGGCILACLLYTSRCV